tara:strand:- start:206 stop:460 length:255 start_codon:yes stop_codon:yes gene_type:complete
MAKEQVFESDVLGVNAKVTTAASHMLDRLIVGKVGSVELDLGTHVLELRTKQKRTTRKKVAVSKQQKTKKQVGRVKVKKLKKRK